MKPALIFLLSTSITLAEPFWKQDGHRSIELTGENGPIVRFVLQAAPRDPHFEILATPDGRNTVWVAPPDHVWHYGLWFSWKYINGVNFWETDPNTGKQQGRNEILDPAIGSHPDADTATICYRELSYPEADEPAVLEDTVEIKVERPTDQRGTQVTWSITTKALADVTLDRTPLPGEPHGKDWGGYAGFSWRGTKEFTEVHYTDSQSRRGMDIHRKHARWLNVIGTLQGKPAGLTILDHPANPRHPTSWYLFHNSKLPFWFANPALLQPKALPMKQGESFRHAYRIILHDGTWQNAECHQAMERFAGKP
ncbi:MAG TPA: DUF6807 family protein [Luteolibacter sp.]|nr:DUF6807 family protein [Luteolibacter sp.]